MKGYWKGMVGVFLAGFLFSTPVFAGKAMNMRGDCLQTRDRLLLKDKSCTYDRTLLRDRDRLLLHDKDKDLLRTHDRLRDRIHR